MSISSIQSVGKTVVSLFKESAKGWDKDRAPVLGAALAYYAIFSIAPLLIIAMGVASLVFGQEAAHGELSGKIDSAVGPVAAQAIQTLIQANVQKGTGLWPTLLGVGALLFGASGLFVHLQESLNQIWEAEPKDSSGIRGFLKNRLLASLMAVSMGLVLMASLVASTVLNATAAYLKDGLPGGFYLWQALDIVASVAVVTLVFAGAYRYLPAIRLEWKSVFVGGLVTAALFWIGKYGLTLYLARSSLASGYGAAGSFLALLVWIYYSSLIIFFGAEFTQAYHRRRVQKFWDQPEQRVEGMRQNRVIRLEEQRKARAPIQGPRG